MLGDGSRERSCTLPPLSSSMEAVKTERLSAQNPLDLARAAELLRGGATVSFPTETVYGLGANALSAAAVEQIFIAKGRPHWDPLIVHLAERSALEAVCVGNALATRLMDAFWPGPLTLLLPRTSTIPDSVTAGRPLVGVRIPAHSVARALLRLCGLPIAAPSANRFGYTSPTTAQHVLDDLDGRIAAVLDGGPSAVGVESTVLEVQEEQLIVYRAGAVTVEMLEAIEGVRRVMLYRAVERSASRDPQMDSLPSPGVGIRHYAPRARMVLVEAPDPNAGATAVLNRVELLTTEAAKVAIMVPEGWSRGSVRLVHEWGPWDDLETLAARLFTGLRALDDAGANVIVCPLPKGGGLGDALRDRLQKAAREK